MRPKLAIPVAMGWIGVLVPLFAALPDSQAQSREEKVRGDKARVEADGFWIYNDFVKGIAEARATGKPLLVVLRCIPCEECVKLDDDLVDTDERLRPLLEKFVRVRLVSTNGLDLSLFQFDTDQSFAVFLLNADGTIYGRFGTRSDQKEWAHDVSIEGLGKALQGALALHARYPEVRESLAAKRGPAPDFPVPESFPTLKGKYGSKLDYDGNVVRSCIHCHQIGDAQRAHYRATQSSLPEQVLFPYPHPKALGLVLDPRERARVLSVAPGTPAEEAGFREGDTILALNGQPLLSIADVQWVLHQVSPEGGVLRAKVKRGEENVEIPWTLAAGWRHRDDIAWRASSWELRRMALGGMFLKPLTDEERSRTGIAGEKLALRVHHVGEFAPHDNAKRAGVRKGDILVSYAGRRDLTRETDLLALGINELKTGAEVSIVVLRENREIALKLPTTR